MVEPIIDHLGSFAIKTGLPPIAWTILGVIFALISGLAYSKVLFSDGVLGGALLLISGLMDILDGSVARLTKTVSPQGAFLDSICDRLSEIFVFTGILIGGNEPLITLLALSFSIMVSYTRARAEGLGVDLAGVGIGERAERIIALAILSIIGHVHLGVLIVLILAVITFIERVFRSTLRFKIDQINRTKNS
ncbi:MAG: CDP-alcohol phosphatidyltransferase family protein [Nitrososphaerales archaeon]|nr:CDP-alcohol phosphatidyltransferase family protein [Nitrososphaerales archaeon]